MVALIALVIPFLCWFVGSILVLVSNAWSRRQKAIGSVLLLAVPIPAPALVTDRHIRRVGGVPAGRRG